MAETPANRRWSRLLVQTLTLLPGALVALLLPGGTWLLWKFAIGNHLLPSWLLVAYVLGVGLPLIVLIRWWYQPRNEFPRRQGRRFKHRQMGRAVAARPQPNVAADDPQAVFCEMSPRRIWGTGRAEPGAYNNGLLLVDTEKRVILFEGDFDCYWIPAAAVRRCDVELHPSSSATTAGVWIVVLLVRLGSGTWEFPFYPLLNIEGRNPWERAMSLCRRMEAVCGRNFASQTTVQPPKPVHSVVG
jgi:hypothetical protein